MDDIWLFGEDILDLLTEIQRDPPQASAADLSERITQLKNRYSHLRQMRFENIADLRAECLDMAIRASQTCALADLLRLSDTFVKYIETGER